MAKEYKIMANKNVLLDLSTLAPDPVYIQIDGTKFELRRVEQMGIKEQARVASLVSRAEKLQVSELSTDEEITEIVDLYDKTMKAMVPTITDKVLDVLRVEQYRMIIDLFTETSRGEIQTDATVTESENDKK